MLVKREIKDSSGITDVTVGVNIAKCCWFQGIKLFSPFIWKAMPWPRWVHGVIAYIWKSGPRHSLTRALLRIWLACSTFPKVWGQQDVVIVQSFSHVRWLFATPWTSLPFPISQSLLRFMSIESMVPSNHLILCCPFSPVSSIIPSIRSFPVSQLFASGSQSIEASASVLPMNIQSWFPLGLTVWPTFSPEDSQESSSVPQFKSINSSVLSLLYGPTRTSIRDHWKNRSFDYMDLCWQRHVFAFNTLSRFVIVFLPRSKCLLTSWLQSLSTVILERAQENSLLLFPFYPHLFAMKWWDQMPWS